MDNKLLNLLYEELILENRKSESVHYTDLTGLLGILKDGVLLAQDYTDKAVDSEKALEVAVLRRSIDSDLKRSKKGLGDLTINAGGIKIYMIDKNILSSVRGATKKPISEFYKFFERQNKESIKRIKEDFSKLFPITEKELSDFIIYALEKIKKEVKDVRVIKELRYSDDVVLRILNEFKKKYNVPENKMEEIGKEIFFIIRNSSYVKYPYSSREGEERIVFKKPAKRNTGIPVSPKYMKIRIEENFFTYKKILEELYVYSRARKLAQLIEKNKDVFIKDRAFDRFLNDLKSVNIANKEEGDFDEHDD